LTRPFQIRKVSSASLHFGNPEVYLRSVEGIIAVMFCETFDNIRPSGYPRLRILSHIAVPVLPSIKRKHAAQNGVFFPLCHFSPDGSMNARLNYSPNDEGEYDSYNIPVNALGTNFESKKGSVLKDTEKQFEWNVMNYGLNFAK
jgi:hypothetical protein